METNSVKSDSSLAQPLNLVRNNYGFTLVELLTVSALIGVLAIMAIPAFADYRERAQTSRSAAEIRGLEKDIIAFASEKVRFPDDLAEIGKSGLLDPWKKAYVYKKTADIERMCNGFLCNSDFDLYSEGPDGLTDPSLVLAEDDIVRANDGAFCASARKYAL